MASSHTSKRNLLFLICRDSLRNLQVVIILYICTKDEDADDQAADVFSMTHKQTRERKAYKDNGAHAHAVDFCFQTTWTLEARTSSESYPD